MPARCLSISPARWPTPRGPGEVKLSGCALLLATATNSGMVLAGNDWLATSATGWVPTLLTRAILVRVVRQLLSHGRIDQQGIGGDEHRVAVGGRLGERRGRHDGAGARAVLDHHRLAAPAHRQEIGKDARHDVGRTASRERNEEPYRPRWKIGGALRRRSGGDAGPRP